MDTAQSEIWSKCASRSDMVERWWCPTWCTAGEGYYKQVAGVFGSYVMARLEWSVPSSWSLTRALSIIAIIGVQHQLRLASSHFFCCLVTPSAHSPASQPIPHLFPFIMTESMEGVETTSTPQEDLEQKVIAGKLAHRYLVDRV